MLQLSEGTLFAHKYRLINQLAASKLTQVWKASELQPGENFRAVKIFLSEKRLDPVVIQLLKGDFARTKTWRHPNLVMPFVFDFYYDSAFLILPYHKEGSLQNRINHKKGVRVLSENQLVTLLEQVSNALVFLHSHNVIHQDVTPSNILIGDHNEYFLTDFGISRILYNTYAVNEENDDASGIHHPHYTSPERFQSASTVSSSSDIFSLGVILFELANGRLPFTEGGKSLLIETTKAAEVGKDVSSIFSEMLFKCLSRNIDERPTAAELLQWAKEYKSNKLRMREKEILQTQMRIEEVRVKEEKETQRKSDEEAKRRSEMKTKRKVEEEEKRKRDEAERVKSIQEARQRAEEEAKSEGHFVQKAEAALKRIEEEIRNKVEDELRARMEQEEKRRIQLEELRQAEERELRKRLESEALKKIEEEKQKIAEESQRRLQEEVHQKVEEELRIRADEDSKKKKYDEENFRKAEEELRKKLEHEARKRIEEETKRIAEESQRRLEEELQKKVDEAIRVRADAEAENKKLSEEALRIAEEKLREKLESEARKNVEEETRRIAEESKRKLAEEIHKKVEEELRVRAKAEAQKKKLDEEAFKKAEENLRNKLEAEARKKIEEETQKRTEESLKKIEVEVRKKVEEELRLQFEVDVKRRKKDEEANKIAEEELRKRIESEVRKNIEHESQKKTEESLKKLETEIRKKVEEELRGKVEAEIQKQKEAEVSLKKTEEELRQRIEAEARKKIEEETQKKTEEALRRIGQEVQRKVEEGMRRTSEEEARKRVKEEITRRKTEEEFRKKVEEEARKKVEEETRRRAEESMRKIEEEVHKKVVNELRLKAEEEAQKRNTEMLQRKVEMELREEELRKKLEEEIREKLEAEKREEFTWEKEKKVKEEQKTTAIMKSLDEILVSADEPPSKPAQSSAINKPISEGFYGEDRYEQIAEPIHGRTFGEQPVRPIRKRSVEAKPGKKEKVTVSSPEKISRVEKEEWTRSVKGNSAKKISRIIFIVFILATAVWYYLTYYSRNDTPEQILRLHGSEIVGKKLIPAIAEEFLIRNGASKVRRDEKSYSELDLVAFSTQRNNPLLVSVAKNNSSTAFEHLRSASCDIGFTSRMITNNEIQDLHGLGMMSSSANEHLFALDAIAIIVHRNNSIQQISFDALAKIFSGQINRWSALRSQSGAIHLYVNKGDLETIDTFSSLVLKNQKISTDARLCTTDDSMAILISRDPSGIGFVRFASTGNTKTLSVSEDGEYYFTPTRVNIKLELYPLTVRHYLYVTDKSSQHYSQEFVDFALSKVGQSLVTEYGFIDLSVDEMDRTPVRNVPPEYLKETQRAIRLMMLLRNRTGSSQLDSRSERDIQRIAEYLRLPRNKNREVLVFGFSSELGNKSDELLLSNTMANKIAGKLKEYGVTPSIVKGFGIAIPIASNETEAGKEKNRRVEIWVR